MRMAVGVVGGGVVAEIEGIYCLHVHAPASVGQDEEVGVVGYWVWRGLAVWLTGELSDGWAEEEKKYVRVCRGLGERMTMTGAHTEILFHWLICSLVHILIEVLGLCHPK